MLPFSVGDTVDRMSILNLKLSFCEDPNKIEFINREISEIRKATSQLSKSIFTNFFATKLNETNKLMWDIQDELHTISRVAFFNRKSKEYSLMKQLNIENDRRGRLKLKINQQCQLQEVKIFKGGKTSALFLGHQGLGDHILCNGLVRYLSSMFDRVHVLCKENNFVAVQEMFSDDATISVDECKVDSHILNCNNDISDESWAELSKNFTKSIRVGIHKRSNDTSNFPLCFYQQSEVPYDTIRSWFNFTSKSSIIPSEAQFTFCHTVASTQSVTIGDCLDNSEMLIIDPDKNHYLQSHRFYQEAQRFIGLKFCDYYYVICNASKIICVDSSFFCLALMVNNSAIDVCFSRQGRSYDNISTQKLKYITV